MNTRLLAQTLHIPAKQWVAVIMAFGTQLGKPTLTEPKGKPPVDADLVVWGTGDTELRCIKDADKQYEPGAQNLFLGCHSPEEAKKIFRGLVAIGLEPKDDLRTLREYALIKGELKHRDVLVASVYLPQTTRALKDSDVVGVIHNPNYPDSFFGKKGLFACTANPYAQALAYGLASVVGAALATWLGRRGRR